MNTLLDFFGSVFPGYALVRDSGFVSWSRELGIFSLSGVDSLQLTLSVAFVLLFAVVIVRQARSLWLLGAMLLFILWQQGANSLAMIGMCYAGTIFVGAALVGADGHDREGVLSLRLLVAGLIVSVVLLCIHILAWSARSGLWSAGASLQSGSYQIDLREIEFFSVVACALFSAGLYPFHAWGDTIVERTKPLTAFLLLAGSNIFLQLFLRQVLPEFRDVFLAHRYLLAWLGMISVALGAWRLARTEKNEYWALMLTLRGLALMAIASGTTHGLAGAWILALSEVLAVGASVIIVESEHLRRLPAALANWSRLAAFGLPLGFGWLGLFHAYWGITVGLPEIFLLSYFVLPALLYGLFYSLVHRKAPAHPLLTAMASAKEGYSSSDWPLYALQSLIFICMFFPVQAFDFLQKALASVWTGL